MASGEYGWNNLSLKGDFTLNDVRKDPMGMQLKAKPETAPLWLSTGNDLKGNELSVKAFRIFDTGIPERNLKLGENRKWAIGFFNIDGPSAFSKVMELTLSDDIEEARRNKAARKKAAFKAKKEADERAARAKK